VIFQSEGDLPTVQHLVDHLLPPHAGNILPADVSRAFEMHGGNVREAFFALYDLFQQRQCQRRVAADDSNSLIGL
jgi:hypothetical protein